MGYSNALPKNHYLPALVSSSRISSRMRDSARSGTGSFIPRAADIKCTISALTLLPLSSADNLIASYTSEGMRICVLKKSSCLPIVPSSRVPSASVSLK